MKLNIPFLSVKDLKSPAGEPTLELEVLGEPTIGDVTVTSKGVMEVGFQEMLPPAIQVCKVWCRDRGTPPPALETLKWYVDDNEVNLTELRRLLDGRMYKNGMSMDLIAMMEVGDMQYYAEVQFGYDQNIKDE